MITIWPQYIDKNLSLKEGRKISKEDAVSEPSIHDIERSLKRLDYTIPFKKKDHIPENGMKNPEGHLLNGKEQNWNFYVKLV